VPSQRFTDMTVSGVPVAVEGVPNARGVTQVMRASAASPARPAAQ
jgi:hypothetical protein